VAVLGFITPRVIVTERHCLSSESLMNFVTKRRGVLGDGATPQSAELGLGGPRSRSLTAMLASSMFS